MNGRVFAKRFVAVVLLVFGFVSLAGDGETWMKALLMAVCIVLAVLLFRRTARDDEWRRRSTGEEFVGQRLSVDGDAPRRDNAGRWVLGATVLHVLAAPFIMLKDLLKMQK